MHVAKTSMLQNGLSQNGASQNGASQNGASQSRASQNGASQNGTMSAQKCGKHARKIETMNRQSFRRFSLIFFRAPEAHLVYLWEALPIGNLRRTQGRQVLHSSFTLGGASLPEWLRGWT